MTNVCMYVCMGSKVACINNVPIMASLELL